MFNREWNYREAIDREWTFVDGFEIQFCYSSASFFLFDLQGSKTMIGLVCNQDLLGIWVVTLECYWSNREDHPTHLWHRRVRV